MWSLDMLELAEQRAVVIMSQAFTACCPATPALSEMLQWCASAGNVIQQCTAVVEQCYDPRAPSLRRLALCWGYDGGDVVSLHLISLAVAEHKHTSVHADFTLLAKLPAEAASIRACFTPTPCGLL